jgi:hypothetical protein
MAGKATHPRNIPIRPFNIRWILKGPIGTCTREPIKKAEVRIATCGILS